MFVLTPNPTFTHKVAVRVPIDGGFRDEEFRATFRVLGTDELVKFDLTEAAGASNFLRAVVSETFEVSGPDDQVLPYSDALRDKLIDIPFVRNALVTAYFGGVSAAKQGN